MTHAKKPSSVFLCHSSNDRRFAHRLGNVLSACGVTTWIDEAEIRVGDSLLNKITEGIERTDYLGAILSPTSISSKWVQKELVIATTMEIEQRRVKVIPILYKDCDIPRFLIDKVYADFRNRSMFQHSLIKLLDVLIPEGFRERILSIVKKAIQAEYSAYKALPKIQTKEIDKYFTMSGSARKRIEHVLHDHRKRKWVISNQQNPSTCEILDLRLHKLENGRAIVETEEYVYLKWFDLKKSSYALIYNEKNRQTYILVKENGGKWKVDADIYPPPKTKSGLYWKIGRKIITPPS